MTDLFQLLGKLEGANPQHTLLFKELISETMLFLDLTCRDMAQKFGCTSTTVRRWLAGTAAPHPAVRTAIYRSLASLVASTPRPRPE